MLPLNSLKMPQKRLFDSGRKHRVAVFVAFASAYDNLIRV